MRKEVNKKARKRERKPELCRQICRSIIRGHWVSGVLCVGFGFPYSLSDGCEGGKTDHAAIPRLKERTLGCSVAFAE